MPLGDVRVPEFSSVDVTDGIWLVTMRRPERMNALHPPANFELAEIFAEFAADPAARVAILTGEGERAFCAGNDLRYQATITRTARDCTLNGGDIT